VRLKSLELQGFKSFVDKTRVQFMPGITAVVGPNGCGKSNVVDAIRWVMGEQSPRRLRGRGMEDVIFAGAEGRAPVGTAEVTLSFDNSGGTAPPAFAEYPEIQISRRLFRTGESEYLMNKTPCRLRDVQDFFRDTGIGTKGYTIVEQGRIAEIVSAKPEERRHLIEEAAGIGKYKARRREAESKIGSTEQNLLRVNDILTEIKRQIASIERQARKAARYKRLRETLRVLELSLAADERRALSGAIAEARADLERRREAGAALEAKIGEGELGVQEKRIELAECERVLTQGSEGLLALRGSIKECEGQIEYGRRERESLAGLIETRRGERAELGEQCAAHERDLQGVADELAGVERAVASGAEQLSRAEAEVATARGAQEGLEAERESANTALVEVLTAIARAEDRLAAVADRRAELEARLRSADEGLEVGQNEASRIDREQSDLEGGLRNLLAERDRLMQAVKDALERHEAAREAEARADETLRSARAELERKRARLESLRELQSRGDDVAEGTRHLLAQGDDAKSRLGLRGLVRDFLEADAEVERAVEAALADRTDALVAETPAGALSALALLRSGGAGRAVFVTPRSDAAVADAAGGFVPLGVPLLERVRPRPGCEDLVRGLLAGVYLVDDLSEALRLYGDERRVPASFVTTAGDLLGADGVVRGGAPAQGGSLSRSRELRELESGVARLETTAQALGQSHVAARTALAGSGDELENLRNRHHTAALAVANHEKDLERTRERVKALSEAHEGRKSERSDLLAELDGLGVEAVRLTERLEQSRGERGERQRALDALGLRLGSAGRELSRLEGVATERRVEHTGRADKRDRLRGTHERVAAALAEARSWSERREAEIRDAERRREELATSIETAQSQLEAHLREEERARAGHDEKRESFEMASAAVQQLEEGVRELRAQQARDREATGRSEIELREREMKLEHLDTSTREKWDVELASWEPPALGDEPAEAVTEAAPAPAAVAPDAAGATEAAEAVTAEAEEGSPDAAREARANAELARAPQPERRAKLEETRKKLQALGDVNLGAIEEHEELKERFRFLSDQKQDLESTLASLRDAIARINRTSRKRFRETFESVSKRFSENFPRLFRGGRASLSLTESEDVLEAGIDIMAMPPGKRLQNVNLLSGGEKTLTAIALLVAVFQVRPAPFFLLDEVDAALDDANVGRFNEIVTELAGESQFVLITHNKRTIEVADVLYGVTMESKGVSKLVAVEMH